MSSLLHLPLRSGSPGYPGRSAVSRDEIDDALAGDHEAMDRLVQRLRPVIHAEVSHQLFRVGHVQGWNPRNDCRDLVQDVFVQLLANGAKNLRAWNPSRAPLETFVRLIARRYVIGMLRSKRRNPWSEVRAEIDQVERQVGEANMEGHAAAQERLARLADLLEGRLDERGAVLFHMLYVEQCPVEEVCGFLGMTPDAVYQWRSRFKKILEELRSQLDGAPT